MEIIQHDRLSSASIKAAQSGKGNVSVKTRAKGWRVHQTLTIWQTKEDLLDFVRGNAHLKAMKATAELTRNVRVYHWESDQLASWKQAENQLNTHAQ